MPKALARTPTPKAIFEPAVAIFGKIMLGNPFTHLAKTGSYYLALLNYVLQIEQSDFAIAIINASEIIPILFSFLLGYFADQNQKRVATIIKTLVVRIAAYLFVTVIIGFNPSLLIVVAVSFANFISDLAGQYENILYIRSAIN